MTTQMCYNINRCLVYKMKTLVNSASEKSNIQPDEEVYLRTSAKLSQPQISSGNF